MAVTTTIAEKTLREMRLKVAGSSSLYAGRLRDVEDIGGRFGFSDLFMLDCDGDFPGAGSYQLGLEYIFEGYLLHYGQSRLIDHDDSDFSLLAGDYMYASGLATIAALKDATCIDALADLVQLCAYVNCESLDRSLAMNAWAITTIRLARHALGADVSFERLSDMVWRNGGRAQELTGLLDGLTRSQGLYGKDRLAEFNRMLNDMDSYFEAEA
ncbi:MAG: hypothetical protein WC828_02530 [Thermoleophilia bacterium]|jgi:hypothetical protein